MEGLGRLLPCRKTFSSAKFVRDSEAWNHGGTLPDGATRARSWAEVLAFLSHGISSLCVGMITVIVAVP